MSGVSPGQRFTRSRPCPICNGHDNAPRGHGIRCAGFISEHDQWSYCTRPEHAGSLPLNLSLCPPAYLHRLQGDCLCGLTHGGPQAAAIIHLPNRNGRRTEPQELGRWDRAYVYTDEEGRPVHRTVRFRDPKSFRHQRYEDRQWKWGLGDTRTVLYHLPDLLLSSPAVPVWIPEGEKDCDRLRALGLIATTNPKRGRWEPWYNPWIEGRHVVILEDRDPVGTNTGYRPGEFYANKLASDIGSAALTVQIVSFPNMPEGSDVSDWLDAGGSVGRLLERVGMSHRLEVAV